MPIQQTLPVEQLNASDLVFMSQTNQLVTDSFLVAQYFNKRHDNVLSKIKSLNCTDQFTNLNFQVCHKNNELQNNKLQPFYQMTKDGLMFLVMGFTGKKAAVIKEAYINAFNEMESQLRKEPKPIPLELLMRPKGVCGRMLIEVEDNQIKGSQAVAPDAFVANKERIIELLADSHVFSLSDLAAMNVEISARMKREIR